jgi:hypothetical protein
MNDFLSQNTMAQRMWEDPVYQHIRPQCACECGNGYLRRLKAVEKASVCCCFC